MAQLDSLTKLSGKAVRSPENELRRRPVPENDASLLVTAVGISLVAFLVYAVTLMPSIGFIDSGELVAATKTLGIVHPTGYPLYTLLGYLVTNFVPLADDPAWRLNLLSALFGALAVGLLYLAVHAALRRDGDDEDVETKQLPSKRRHARVHGHRRARSAPDGGQRHARSAIEIAGAASAAGLLAGSHSFWLWAVQAKVYTLHESFVAALFLVAFAATRSADMAPRSRRRLLAAFALLLGASFTNHVMTIFVVPGLVVLFVAAQREVREAISGRSLTALLAAFALPLLLYLYLPLRSAQHPLMNWGMPVDWASFWRHVTGWQYRSYLVDQDLTLAEKLRGAVRLWRDQFHPAVDVVVLVLASFGVLRLAARRPSVFASTALTAGLQVFFALTFGTTPEIHESYFVPFYMMMLIWAGVGVVAISEFVKGTAGIAVAVAVPLVVSSLAFTTNWHQNDRRLDYLAPRFIENAYAGLPGGSIVLSDLWEVQAASFYEQHVRATRTDLRVVDINLARYPWYMDHLERQYPELIADVAAAEKRYRELQEVFVSGGLTTDIRKTIQEAYLDVLGGIVRANVARGRPVYAMFQDLYARGRLNQDESAIVGKFFHPDGLMIEVDASPAPHDVTAPRWDLAGVADGTVYKDSVATHICSLYPAALSNIGRYKLLTGDAAEGRRLLETAQRLTSALGAR